MPKINSNKEKGVGLRRFEFVMLIVCLTTAVLRVTHMESLLPSPINSPGLLDGPGWSMIITSVPVFGLIIWAVISLSRKEMFYRFSGIEIGTVIFLAAAVWGIFCASNKRAAINETATYAAIFGLGVLLVQLLDSQKRIRLALMAIVAAGAVNTYECAWQYFISNDAMINQYEKNPKQQLAMFGIEPGSLEHAMFVHRLESKDVKGYFTTGNSAAAFNIMAIAAAAALLISECRATIVKKIKRRNIAIYAAYAAWVMFGIALTHSKGGIGGLVLAGMMFGICCICIRRFKKYSKTLLIAGIVIAAVATAAIANYGVKHGGLGGGNSMLVRWQYWSSTVQMCKDNLLKGVGGGNFNVWYTKYKLPESVETVKDPHCFVLSVLSQYGIFGLIGFIAVFAVPMMRTALGRHDGRTLKSDNEQAGKWRHGAIGAAILTIGVFVLRPIVINEFVGENAAELIFVIIYLYVLVGIVFGVTMFFLWIAGRERTESEQMFSTFETAAILCVLAGVIVHNLVDFALFEPGVMTTFIILVACVVAMNEQTSGKNFAPLKLPRAGRVLAVAGCVIVAAMFVRFAAYPTVKADSIRQKAIVSDYRIIELLDEAATVDAYNPEYNNMAAKVYLQRFYYDPLKRAENLERSAEQFEKAIRISPCDFKNYEKAAQVYKLWAEVIWQDTIAARQKQQLAYENLKKAVELYPGSGRLNFKLGEICEILGTDDAAAYYLKAVEIEDAFRQMYQKMYPGRELTSRLGEDKYQIALDKAQRHKGTKAQR